MRFNDLSNRQAPSLLFRLDNFVVKPKEGKTTDKVLNFILGESRRSTVDEDVAKVMNDIYRRTDYSMALVVLDTEWRKYSANLKNDIMDLPIRDIYMVHDHFDIYYKLQKGEYTFYVDDNLTNHNLVGHNACITLSDVTKLAKGGSKHV